jgi:hypothetical protein
MGTRRWPRPATTTRLRPRPMISGAFRPESKTELFM